MFDKSYSSLPTRYTGKKVWVKGTYKTVEVFLNHEQIKLHPWGLCRIYRASVMIVVLVCTAGADRINQNKRCIITKKQKEVTGTISGKGCILVIISVSILCMSPENERAKCTILQNTIN